MICSLLLDTCLDIRAKAAVIAKKSGKPVPVDPMAMRNAKVKKTTKKGAKAAKK